MRVGVIILFLSSWVFSFAKAQTEKALKEKTAYESKNLKEIKGFLKEEYPIKEIEKGTGIKQLYRRMYNHSRYVNKDGQLRNFSALIYDEYSRYMDQNPQYRSSSYSPGGYWSAVSGEYFSNQGGGYNPGMGRLNCIEADPNNDNILFVGAPSGGLWKSMDAGQSWEPLTDGMINLGVSAIAIDPTDTQHIYILTGDGNASHTYCAGILETFDGGQNWQPTGMWFSEDLLLVGNALEIHPSNPNRLFAALSDGLHVSVDGGETWVRKFQDRCYDVEFLPGDDDVVIVASDYAVYRSTNAGDTFSAPNNIMPVIGNGLTHRQQLAVTPLLPNYVYLVGGSRQDGFNGLYRSADGGQNWLLLSEGNEDGSEAPNILNSLYSGSWTRKRTQANRNLGFAVPNQFPMRVVVGGIMNWIKDVAVNDNWTRITTKRQYVDPADAEDDKPYVHPDVCDLKYIGTKLYCCNDGGLHRSDDNGATWVDLSDGLGISQFYEIDNTNTTSPSVIGGTQDIGTNLVQGSGNDLIHVLGADGGYPRFKKDDPTQVYASQQGGDLNFSTDGGLNYTDFPNPDCPFIAPFELIGNTLDGWLGTDQGLDFVDFSTNSVINITSDISEVTEIAVSEPINHSVYYANEDNVRLIRYNSSLTTILQNISINAGLPVANANVSGLAADPDDEDNIVVTFGGFVDGEKVYYSDDSGSSWQNLSGSLPNVPVLCATVDPYNAGGIYIGTAIGVFYRNTDLGDWVYFSNGLPRVPVEDLDIIPVAQKLRAATYGRGVWETGVYSSCSSFYTLTQNNDPSNPNYTGIQYYQSSGTINSTRIITGGPGTQVVYQSEGEVNLNTGFEVNEHNRFDATIAPCEGGVIEAFTTPTNSQVIINSTNQSE